MQRNKLFGLLTCGVLGLGAFAIGAGFSQPGDQPEFELPKGWTMEDMMACIEAGTPGEQHAWLAEDVGTWSGKGSMWMGPDDANPMTFESTMTVTAIMDGRYIRTEMEGEMPGMGMYTGQGVSGYDNVAGRFVSNWIDNQSTGIMNGTGAKSGDTLTWTFEYMCPITRKPTKMREVYRIVDANTRKMEMHGADPKSGKQYKMMEFTLTRR